MALRANWEACGGAELRPRPASRRRIRVQARIRPRPASAMRCIAATRLGNPLRGERKTHGKGLREVVSSGFKTPWDFSKYFLSRRNGGLPNPARRGKPQRGWGKAPLAAGNLFTEPPTGRAPSRRRRLLAQPVSQVRAKRPTPHPLLLRLSALETSPVPARFARKCASVQM